MRTQRKLLSLLTSIFILFTIIPQTALANVGETVSVSDEENLRQAIENASSDKDNPTIISLSDDIAITDILTVPSGRFLTIDGQNHALKRADDSENSSSGTATLTKHAMLLVRGDLTIRDLTVDAKGDSAHCLRSVVVNESGHLAIYNSVITGGYGATGAGLAVAGNGTIDMYSGEISHNVGTTAAGVVAVDNGVFNMYEGSVCYNEGTQTGGFTLYWYKYGQLNLFGGSVHDNTGKTHRKMVCAVPCIR